MFRNQLVKDSNASKNSKITAISKVQQTSVLCLGSKNNKENKNKIIQKKPFPSSKILGFKIYPIFPLIEKKPLFTSNSSSHV